MKILWLTNVELPKIANMYNRNVFVGGWLNETAYNLAGEYELSIASMCNQEYEIRVDNIDFYGFKENDCESLFNKLLDDIDPDIIHIWGSEYRHSLLMYEIAKQRGMADRCVVSLQGLVSYASKYHYNAFLDNEIINNGTFIESITNRSIANRRDNMSINGKYEIELLKNIKHCIGRTDYDMACVKLINPDIKYHYCNEILRKGFYNHVWNYGSCDKNTIFFSQTNYPIKGFHIMLEALGIVKKYVPDIKLKAIGDNTSLIEKAKAGSYRKYLNELIKKYDLYDNVEWLGYLDEASMIYEYLKCNIFVSASSIENSSNSISEAMLMGVPVIASDVGGIKSMMIHEKEGLLYQADAPYMLAYNIIELLRNPDVAIKLGSNAHTRASKDHDIITNMVLLKNIYNSIKG